MVLAAKKMAYVTCNKTNIGNYKEPFIYEPLMRQNQSGQMEEVEQYNQKTGYTMGENVSDYDVIGHRSGHHEPGFRFLQEFYEMSFYKLTLEASGKEHFIIVQVMEDFDGFLLENSLENLFNNPSMNKAQLITEKMQTLRRMSELFDDMKLISLVENNLSAYSLGWINSRNVVKPLLLLSDNLKVPFYDTVTEGDMQSMSNTMLVLFQNYYKINSLDQLNQVSVPSKIMNSWMQLFNSQVPTPDAFEYVLSDYMKNTTQFTVLGGAVNKLMI
jgi:hypothetical protein